jgi:glutamate dehydrogenase
MLTTWLRGHDLEIVTKQAEDLMELGVPADLARDVAGCLYGFSLLDIIDIADIADRDGAEVADLYFTLMDDLRVDDLLTAVSQLERNDRWHSLARLAIRDDIYSSLRALTMDVLSVGEPDETGEQKIAEWEFTNASRLERARGTLAEIFASGEPDLATLSVAARQIRGMIRSSISGPA